MYLVCRKIILSREYIFPKNVYSYKILTAYNMYMFMLRIFINSY